MGSLYTQLHLLKVWRRGWDTHPTFKKTKEKARFTNTVNNLSTPETKACSRPFFVLGGRYFWHILAHFLWHGLPHFTVLRRKSRNSQCLCGFLQRSRAIKKIDMRKEGFEPPRPFGHKILSLARLPVPPLPQWC